jgi:hypothetical protein
MKLSARVDINRLRARLEAERIRRRLSAEIERELQTVMPSDQVHDPAVRRDAIERAVRRLWGATL